MHDDRLTFLAAAHGYRPVLAHPAVVERWSLPSALAEWTVGGVAAHAARATFVVEDYLAADVDRDELPISAAEYVATVATTMANDAEASRAVRERGDALAARGHAAILADYDMTIDRLRTRLAEEPVDRLVRVIGGLVLTLDEYLLTRLVEIVVHTDDVCVSASIETPHIPGIERAVETLVDAARHRHGDIAVVRALARRERDEAQAFRVF